MSIINITDLKAVLGVGSIYSDATLQQVADAASNIILSYLTFNDAAVIAAKLEDNTATFSTLAPHSLNVGDALTVSGCGTPFNGSRTVTEIGAQWFKAAITNADIDRKNFKPFGKAVQTSQATLYDNTAEIRECALAVAVDIFETQKGTMGQQGVDFQPAPYRLSRSLLTRVSALMAKHVDTNAWVG